MRRLQRPLILALRLCLGALLCYAALTKWSAPRAFAEDVANYRLLPAVLVPAATISLLGAGTLLGVLLLLGVWLREVVLLSTLLYGLFAAAVASALVRDLKIDCGCFGAGGTPATSLTLLRDLGFFSAAVLLCWLSLRGGAASAPGQTAAGAGAG